MRVRRHAMSTPACNEWRPDSAVRRRTLEHENQLSALAVPFGLYGDPIGDALEHVSHDWQHCVLDEPRGAVVEQVQHPQLGLLLVGLDAERQATVARIR